MRLVIERLVDAGSFFELKKLFAGELLTGFARVDGHPIGIVANQPKVKGGVLFVDSADKAARFIGLCDAFGLPLLFLADVPGFMIGKQVEREGIIRAGAKMIMAVSEATVPRVSVIVRKAYGAGLYAMSGPGFEPEACLALPSAMIAVMGPEAAVNAVYYNKLQGLAGARAQGRGGQAAPGVPRGRRHRATRERARGRCHRAPGSAARRDRRPPAVCPRPPRPTPAEAPQRHAGLSEGARRRQRPGRPDGEEPARPPPAWEPLTDRRGAC